MKIVHSPNFGRISQHMARNLAKEFLKLGVYIIHDNARRIPQKIDYNDAPQKENEDKTIKRKGHDTPLRDDFVLGSGANYTINGQPMVMASVPRTPDITLRLPETQGPVDTGTDRTIRVVTLDDRALQKLYGEGANEYRRTVLVMVKHVLVQQDLDMEKRMDGDEQDITMALQASGIDWPTGLVNIIPAPGGDRVSLTGDGADVMLQSVPFTIIYEES